MTPLTNPRIRGWRHYDDSPNDATIPVVGGIVFLGLGLGLGGFALYDGALVVGICLGTAMMLPGIGLFIMAAPTRLASAQP